MKELKAIVNMIGDFEVSCTSDKGNRQEIRMKAEKLIREWAIGKLYEEENNKGYDHVCRGVGCRRCYNKGFNQYMNLAKKALEEDK